jgi:seryl-tRNA synthetase
MIDLKAARADPDPVRAALHRKSAAEAFDALLAADVRWRELQARRDELRARQKALGKPSSSKEVDEARELKASLQQLEVELQSAESERQALWEQVPNPPHPDVPDGATEEDAAEIRRVGDPSSLGEAREHVEVGRFDMERAARLSGSRFGYLIGDTALLAFAVYRYALDRLSSEGFTAMIPPVLVREEAMFGTGFFPTERSNIYAIESDGLYLTGTSEVALAGLHMGEILEETELPLHYAAFSTNFRREAGAAGKDTRGMFRVHQFNKVEMFVFTRPEESWEEHERLLEIEESLVQGLGLPYRVVDTAAGDLGASAARKYDVDGSASASGASKASTIPTL